LQIISQTFLFDRGVPVFNILIQGEPLNSGTQSSTLKKLERSLYHYDTDVSTEYYFVLLQIMRLTDGRTDRKSTARARL